MTKQEILSQVIALQKQIKACGSSLDMLIRELEDEATPGATVDPKQKYRDRDFIKSQRSQLQN